MKMIRKWITPLGIALIVCAPITSSAAVKIYSAPQGIEARYSCSSRTTVGFILVGTEEDHFVFG